MSGTAEGLAIGGGVAVRRRIQELWSALTRSDFLRQVAETFATRIFLLALGVVTSVLVTRALGPEGRGYFAVAAAVSAIGVQVGNLGLHASNTYLVAKDPRLLATLIGNSLLISFAFGGMGAAAAWVIFAVWPALAPLGDPLLALALASVPFGLAYLLLQNLLIGTQRVRAYNTWELVNKVASVALIGVLILAGTVSAVGLFAGTLGALLIGFFGTLAVLWRQANVAPRVRPTLLAQHSRYGLKAYVAALCAFLVLRADLLMVQYILGPEETGYYSIAVALADMLYMLPVIVGSLLFPRLVKLPDGARERHAWRVVSGLTAVMVPLALTAALFAAPAISLLYGEEFGPAVRPFLWLLPAIVLLSLNTIFMNYFASINMPLITVYSPAIGAVVNIALNLILLPRWGTVGASISSIVAYGLMLAMSIVYLGWPAARLVVSSK